jgi:hypothetical protein
MMILKIVGVGFLALNVFIVWILCKAASFAERTEEFSNWEPVKAKNTEE